MDAALAEHWEQIAPSLTRAPLENPDYFSDGRVVRISAEFHAVNGVFIVCREWPRAPLPDPYEVRRSLLVAALKAQSAETFGTVPVVGEA